MVVRTLSLVAKLYTHTPNAHSLRQPYHQLLLIPCYQAAPNTTIDMTVDKTIAMLGYDTISAWDGLGVRAFIGVATAANSTTGFKQIASTSASSFYISGGGSAASGFLYIANVSTSTAIPILGQSAGQPGYLDARGTGIYGGNLYGTSGDASPQCVRCNSVFKIGAGNPTASRCARLDFYAL